MIRAARGRERVRQKWPAANPRSLRIAVGSGVRRSGGGDGQDVSRRTQRIASVIRNVVAEAIRTQLSDPRVEPWTSVTRVQVSPDLTVAHVNVSVMAENPARRKLCVQALQAASGRLRSMLARHLTARQIPRLEFHLDDSVQQSIRTVDAIDRVLAESARPLAAAEPREEAAAQATGAEGGPALDAEDGVGRAASVAATERRTPER